ncbi:MAG TPA: nuclear transport factor 2 family protein [Terriglobales bacterium]
MRRSLSAMTLAFIVFCLAPSLFASRPTAPTRTTREQAMIREVLELERHTTEAALRNDANFTERMVANDYLAIGPLGNVITKRDSMNVRRRSQVHYDSIEVSELVVRIYGETAVVTGRADVRGNDGGEDFSGPYRFTRVWVKHNGSWQAVAYQATVTQ